MRVIRRSQRIAFYLGSLCIIGIVTIFVQPKSAEVDRMFLTIEGIGIIVFFGAAFGLKRLEQRLSKQM